MDNQGWIKDYRKEMDSDIWVMPPLYLKVWQYLKYMVNHKKNEIPMTDGSKEIIERGQHLTSYRGIAKGVSYYEGRTYKEPSARMIKKILEWLEKNNMISITHGRGNRQYTKITLVNYSLYQAENNEGVTVSKQLVNSEETQRKHLVNSEETDGKQTVHINKNDKNDIRMNKNEEEGKEREELPKLEPLSFPTPSCQKIYKLIGENGYRFFINADIKENDNTISIKTKSNVDKSIIAQYIPRIDWQLDKRIEVI
ncbi:hypothetical protein J2Z53_001428 [Clostridium moniliforme]|uniref:DnaA N-terminal domain-containing protein n=1 Tax=Clostridium moniliforme TaxID=39489 RepID=A0ABS4F0R2_9CLOT|nr:hypothetical protein [Clostridium moniliforme]MBP1889845.1 hypothetical protein [Clostridium moniliforme]